MKKFEFHLKTLMKVRHEAEREAYRNLMAAHVHLKNMLKIIESLEREYLTLNEDIERPKKNTFSAQEIAEQHGYMLKMEERIKIHIEEVVKAQYKVEDMRQAVMRAMQQKKMLENLYEKQYESWIREYLINEVGFFDEVSSIRHSSK
jgi:flagellar FliJ protein